jgi:hypothetical protein
MDVQMQPGERVVRSHPWEVAGLGRAPYKFMGMTKAVFAMPGGYTKPGGSCDYCGQGIMYEFHCKSSDGKRFKVGCDCIARCHLPAETIVGEAKRALKEHKAEERRAKREVSTRAARDERAARERARAADALARALASPLYARIKAAQDALEASNRESGFLGEMRKSFERWGKLTEKQEAAVLGVLDRIEGEPARKAATFYLGAVGDRVKIAGTVELAKCIREQWSFSDDPPRYLNKIRTDAGALVVWFGGYGLKVGARIEGTGKLSKLEEYQGERQNVIKNPRWKE